MPGVKVFCCKKWSGVKDVWCVKVSGLKGVVCKRVPGVIVCCKVVWCHRCLVKKLSMVPGVKVFCCKSCVV